LRGRSTTLESNSNSRPTPITDLQLSSIALARHGPVALKDEPWTAPRNLGAWIDRYQSAGILPSEPPNEIKEYAAHSRLVCSTAMRCVESARRISPLREILTDRLYREAELPHSLWKYPKLPPPMWALVFRAAWFRGFSAHAESYAEANLRAHHAAQQLVALARSGGPVLLMGHGIMNALITRHLLALGCRGSTMAAARHWGFNIYQLP
jgi:histidine phosphatase superfamily protein (branch 1)